MKKILHVTECHAGGVSRALEARRNAADKFTHSLLWAGEEFPVFHEWSHCSPLPKGFFSRVKAIKHQINEIKPDAIHAHSSWAGVYTRLLSLDVPVIYEPHCFKFDDPRQPSLLKKIFYFAEKVLAQRASAFLTLSDHETDLVKKLNPTASAWKIPNVPSIYPSEEHTPSKFRIEPRVYMIGRLSPQKDPVFLANVARRCRQLGIEIDFVWIGDGDQRYKHILMKEGIKVTGWLNQDQLANYLSQPALYMHVANYEGFPLSILDAAVFEHPIIARTIPAFDKMGIPQFGSVDEAIALLQEILKGGHSADLATQAAKNLKNTMTFQAQRHKLNEAYSVIMAGEL